MNKIITIFVLILLPFLSKAQIVEETSNLLSSNVHLKMGIGVSSVLKGEFVHPRPYFGFNVGAQALFKLSDKLSLMSELNLHFKGSNFKTETDTSYSKLRILSLEVPLAFAYYLNKKDDSHQFIFAGAQYALHMDQAVYFNGDNQKKPLPYGLSNFDISAIVGHQFQMKNVGFQSSFKLGLTDLNKNFYIPGAYPSFGTGKSIKSWSLEFALIF